MEFKKNAECHVSIFISTTRHAIAKPRPPLESPHRIGITTIRSDVLMAVGGAWAGDQKNVEPE